MNPLITFDTTHHALWAEQLALQHGLGAQVVPAPAAAQAKCSLALEVLEEDLPTLCTVLNANAIVYAVFRS